MYTKSVDASSKHAVIKRILHLCIFKRIGYKLHYSCVIFLILLFLHRCKRCHHLIFLKNEITARKFFTI